MKLRFELPACFAGAAVLVGLGAWLSFGSFRQVEHAGLDRERSFSLLTLANGWLSSLKDAETGYRGYLLTRDEAYLEPYARVRDSLRGTLGILNQLTLDASARTELDGVAPELEASLAKMAEGIERRRTGNAAPAEGLGPSKRLMDSIRSRMQRYLQLEQDLRTQREKQFQANLRRMLLGIWATSLLTLLLALAVAYSLYQESRRRFKQLVYRGTLRLLEGQKELNGHLERANTALQENEELLRVTLHSIGDAVLTTDNEGHLKTLNSVAEQITGWTQAEAAGRPVDEAFHLISQETRQPAVIPVRETLAKGTIHGLANHTILVARDGRECAIADSCAPIRDRAGQVIGAVMVFRDVTQDYARQQALRESSALVKMVLDTVADGIITLDVDGSRVETANPAAERMFG